MPGKGNTGIVNHTFMHRRRHHRGKFSATASRQRLVKQGKHIPRIGSIQLPRRGRLRQWCMDDVQRPRQRRQGRSPRAQHNVHPQGLGTLL